LSDCLERCVERRLSVLGLRIASSGIDHVRLSESTGATEAERLRGGGGGGSYSSCASFELGFHHV
jgi:hypothetical protein